MEVYLLEKSGSECSGDFQITLHAVVHYRRSVVWMFIPDSLNFLKYEEYDF